jgi:hypothetical protein
MRDAEWEDSLVEGGPEALLDNLLKSGYPWHALGQRLKNIDQEFRIISNEYAAIHDSLEKLNGEVDAIRKQNKDVTGSLPQIVNASLTEQTTALQNRWLLASGSMLIAALGLVLSVTSSPRALQFLKVNGPWVGLVLILAGVVALLIIARRQRTPK